MSHTLKQITNLLNSKSATKQQIYQTTLQVFEEFKKCLHHLMGVLNEQTKKSPDVEIKYTEAGPFEVHFKFSGDILVFMMHTNVFTFHEGHYIKKTNYINEDPMRAYCGLIQVYNFLSDSIKYNRAEDLGELVARIFINHEKHFFIEGKRPLNIKYNNLETEIINPETINDIIMESINYCLNFDLITPPMEIVQNITVEQKNYQSYSSGFATSKNVGIGFQLRNELEK